MRRRGKRGGEESGENGESGSRSELQRTCRKAEAQKIKAKSTREKGPRRMRVRKKEWTVTTSNQLLR